MKNIYKRNLCFIWCAAFLFAPAKSTILEFRSNTSTVREQVKEASDIVTKIRRAKESAVSKMYLYLDIRKLTQVQGDILKELYELLLMNTNLQKFVLLVNKDARSTPLTKEIPNMLDGQNNVDFYLFSFLNVDLKEKLGQYQLFTDQDKPTTESRVAWESAITVLGKAYNVSPEKFSRYSPATQFSFPMLRMPDDFEQNTSVQVAQAITHNLDPIIKNVTQLEYARLLAENDCDSIYIQSAEVLSGMTWQALVDRARTGRHQFGGSGTSLLANEKDLNVYLQLGTHSITTDGLQNYKDMIEQLNELSQVNGTKVKIYLAFTSNHEHGKIMLLLSNQESTVLTGSANFTDSSQFCEENNLKVKEQSVSNWCATEFMKNWNASLNSIPHNLISFGGYTSDRTSLLIPDSMINDSLTKPAEIDIYFSENTVDSPSCAKLAAEMANRVNKLAKIQRTLNRSSILEQRKLYGAFYSLSDATVINSLCEAAKAGVDVKIVLDQRLFDQSNICNIEKLIVAGVNVYRFNVNKPNILMHNKLLLALDENGVPLWMSGGSYNASRCNKKRENLIFINKIDGQVTCDTQDTFDKCHSLLQSLTSSAGSSKLGSQKIDLDALETINRQYGTQVHTRVARTQIVGTAAQPQKTESFANELKKLEKLVQSAKMAQGVGLVRTHQQPASIAVASNAGAGSSSSSGSNPDWTPTFDLFDSN